MSLLIVNSGEEEVSELPSCYCDACGSTDIGQTDIFTWEKMYNEKYKSVIEKEKENIFKYGRK